MPECGAVESALGVAVARMETAKRETMQVFDAMYPGMISDRMRSDWMLALMSAHLALEVAMSRIEDASEMLHKKGERIPAFSAHPKAPEPGSQDQPTKEDKPLADPPAVKTGAPCGRCESLLITLRDILQESSWTPHYDIPWIELKGRLERIVTLASDALDTDALEGKPSGQ